MRALIKPVGAVLILGLILLVVSEWSQKKGAEITARRDTAVWGVNILAFPFPYATESQFDLHKDKMWDSQIDYLKQGNIEAVRLTAGIDNIAYLSELIDKLSREDIRILLVLEDPAGPDALGNEEDHGYRFASEVIKRFRDKVDYYQLANEIGGSAILNASYSGISLDHYDPIRLKLTLDFVAGAERAVAEFDPSAQKVLTINSANTAILRATADRGIDFDIVGWNWFSDFGMELTNPIINRSSGETYPLLANLKSFGKPLWLTEIAWRGDARSGGEHGQATFLENAITTGLKSGFSGFFPFVLVEDVVKLPGYGLLRNEIGEDGFWGVTGPRQAYLTYQAIIKREEGE